MSETDKKMEQLLFLAREVNREFEKIHTEMISLLVKASIARKE